jgi:hypothetical protein
VGSTVTIKDIVNQTGLTPQAIYKRIKAKVYTMSALKSKNTGHFTPEGERVVRDLFGIVEEAKPYDFVLTTEKDIQRLKPSALVDRLQEQGKRLIALPIRVKFLSDQSAFDRKILTYTQENKRR